LAGFNDYLDYDLTVNPVIPLALPSALISCVGTSLVAGIWVAKVGCKTE
jgi:hypothetical protein